MPQGISAVRPTNGLYLYHYFGFIITVINISLSPITCLFFLILLPFNQKSYSMLKLQVSDCSTSRILCYVPNMATFCRESIECFLDTVMNFFYFNLFANILLAPIFTDVHTLSNVPRSLYLYT